jgi:hybrid cluster-associated redox disulfide protein
MPTKNNKEKITEKTLIVDVVSKYPETIEVFHKHGLHCFGCAMARMETVGDGALVHGIDVKDFIDALNAVARKKK